MSASNPVEADVGLGDAGGIGLETCEGGGAMREARLRIPTRRGVAG